MRSQTATTTNNRKRGRESTGVSSSPVRSTRLKTGRHPPPPPRHHSLVTATAAVLDDLIKVEDDLQTDDELVKMLRRAEEDDPATEDWDEEIISFKKKKKMMMIKKENKNLSPATVIGPPSSLSDGTGPADHDQPTPSKNRKTSLLLLQQQQQVANGFPVTVFPPAADNNNSSPPPPPPSAGPFQQRLNNNSSSKNSSSRANSKPEQKLAVISRHPVKEAPPSLSSSSSAAATRRDNNNGDEAATAAAAVMVAVTSAAASIRRQQMKEAFQPWVMQTYGDAAKTKTISRRKSERIARILRGEDRSNGADSSKFRFWVRAKGFRLGATAGNSDSSSSPSSSISSDLMSSAAEPLSATNDPSHDELYVVTSTAKDEMGGEDRPVYKKVAVVEDFFDIIYREHVEFMSNSGGRPPTGKHAGQKRTYRAITEIYAFLPREAVTRFLMQCADCQRRGNGASSVVNPPSSIGPGAVATPATNGLLPSNQGVSPGSPTPPASPHTPANVTTATAAAPSAAAKSSHHLPPTPPQSSRHASTTTTSSSSSWSQQQLRYLGLGQASPIPPTPSSSLLMGLAVTTNNIDLSLPLTSTLLKRATLAGVSHQQLLGLDRAESSFSSAGASSQHHLPARGMTAGYQMDQQEIKQNSSTPNRMTTSNATDPITLDLSSKTSDVAMCDGDHSPGTVKDEDDEDDDDVDDRIDTQDPERLKAFNMFVRLFVDENLDRMVPISRQPREKIQAIIDSCLRQFPEFGERARKRIRTYLKSCRRHKRTRDDPGTPAGGVGSGLLSPNRPMPSHLTSVVAEQILAQACENENQNAKRLRLGLEPISQPLPPPTTNEGLANSPTTLNSQPTEAVHSPQSSTATTPTSTTAASPGQITNLFRPAFGPYQRSNSSTNAQPVPINQGPTDLSTKSRQTPAILGPPNGLSNRSSPLQPHKLNAAEILAVRQLVTGYRESAAFLLRSADELEQLLHQQHSPL